MVPACPGHLIVRADGDVHIGTGHLHRCLALAQSWMAARGKATFLSDCDSDSLRRRIEASRARFIPLLHRHPDPEDVRITLELARKVAQRSAEQRATWLVLDGYHFGPEYQEAIRAEGHSVLVIDDMAHHSRYHADLLLNQNASALRLTYEVDVHTKRLLGPTYALLRPEFLGRRGRSRSVPPQARNLLVSLGGSDPANATAMVVSALSAVSPALEVRIVGGASNPNLEALSEVVRDAAERHHRVRLLTNVYDMSEQMAWADVAVSAGGSTCWELAYMGVPNLILVLAENQILIAEALNDAGVSVNLGWSHDLHPRTIAEKLSLLVADPVRRQSMSDLGRKLVDGHGADRVVRALCSINRNRDAHSVPG